MPNDITIISQYFLDLVRMHRFINIQSEGKNAGAWIEIISSYKFINIRQIPKIRRSIGTAVGYNSNRQAICYKKDADKHLFLLFLFMITNL